MRKKIILVLIMVLGVLAVSFTSDILSNYSSSSNESNISARAIDANYEIELEKNEIMTLHKKYSVLVSEIYSKYELDIKDLKEDNEDSELISRIVCMEVDNYEKLKNTWFGIVYDEENNPKEISFYLDGEYNSYLNSDDKFAIKGTIIEDIGNLFFARSEFKNDVEGFFNNASSEPGLNSATYLYKKGMVTLSINGDKISLKINLNG